MPLQKFQYEANQLQCEEVPLKTIAVTAGTPVFVYSSAAIRENLDAYKRSLEGIPYEIHYAVKANSSLAVLALLASEGAGFDIVSGGELFRVLRARGNPAKDRLFGRRQDSRRNRIRHCGSGSGSFIANRCRSWTSSAMLLDECGSPPRWDYGSTPTSTPGRIRT